jgi:hypothetical protein
MADQPSRLQRCWADLKRRGRRARWHGPAAHAALAAAFDCRASSGADRRRHRMMPFGDAKKMLDEVLVALKG